MKTLENYDDLIYLEKQIVDAIIYHGLSFDEAEKIMEILENKLEKKDN
jgi:hypothetical protein